MRVHKGKALVAGAAILALGVAACSSSGGTGKSKSPSSGASSGSASGSSSYDPTQGTKGTGAFQNCATQPNTCNSGTTTKGGTVTYTIEKTISGWNLNSAASNTFDYAEILDAVLPNAFVYTPDLKANLDTRTMVSAEQTKTKPQTLVYKIKPDAVWNDGQPVDASDFQYSYESQNSKKCPNCAAASNSGYDQIQSLTPSDNGKTVTVVMAKPFADWQVMFGSLYPGHIAKQHGWNGTPAGTLASFKYFDATRPAYSAGPYVISDYQKDTSVTLTPNPKWYGTTKPSLSKLVFRIITDQNQEVPALQNNEVQVIYPQPNQNLVQQADGIQGVQTYLGKGLNWEHLDLNTTNQFLKDKALRTAIFDAVSRTDIINRTVGQFVPGIKPLNNHLFLPGQPGYQDNVTASKHGSGDVALAKQTLTAAGYTGVGSNLKTKSGQTVTFRCTYSAGNTLRQQTCVIIQAALKQLGLNITLKPVPDLSILDKGDFDMVIFAWVGTPFIAQGAQQLFTSTSSSNYTKNKDAAADAIINSVASTTDKSTIPARLNAADKLLVADAVSLPLFQKPTFIAAKSNIVNIRDNATSFGPPYNVDMWGLKG